MRFRSVSEVFSSLTQDRVYSKVVEIAKGIRDDNQAGGFLKSEDVTTRLAGGMYLIESRCRVELYPSQVFCASEIIAGKLVEMSTGEGKSYSIALAALAFGKKVVVVSPSESLSTRDFKAFSKMCRDTEVTSSIALEMSEGLEEVFSKTVIFTTPESLMFNSLKNIKGFYADSVIIDEVDYVLIDNATSSFGMSGDLDEALKEEGISSENFFRMLYGMLTVVYNEMRITEKSKEDPLDLFNTEIDAFIYSDGGTGKRIAFTSSGIEKMQGEARDLASTALLLGCLKGVITANRVFKRNVNYAVMNDRIVWINQRNGEYQEKTSIEFENQYAVEFKEGCSHRGITFTEKSTCYQRVFSKCGSIAGLSGTTREVSEELCKEYNFTGFTRILDHFNCTRKDNEPIFCWDEEDAVNRLLRGYPMGDGKCKGRDTKCGDSTGMFKNKNVLIITYSEKVARELSEELKSRGVECDLMLGSNNFSNDIEITVGIPLISTVLLGRGVNISMQGKEKELTTVLFGWLRSNRVRRQALGRSGRQGNVGTTHQYIFPEDELLLDQGLYKGKSKSKQGQDETQQMLSKSIQGKSKHRQEKSKRNHGFKALHRINQLEKKVLAQERTMRENLFISMRVEDNVIRVLKCITEEDVNSEDLVILTVDQKAKCLETLRYRDKLFKFEYELRRDIAEKLSEFINEINGTNKTLDSNVDYVTMKIMYFILENY